MSRLHALLILLTGICSNACAQTAELSQAISVDGYQWAGSATEETLKEPLSREITEPETPVRDTCLPVRAGKKTPKIHFASVKTQVTYLQPQAVNQLKDLEQLNPGLSKVLPGLAKLLPQAKTSPKFKVLYHEKARALANGEALAFGDYFDCATVLDLQDPDTKRSAILFQSDMDCDTDGTDPKRFPGIESYPAALTDAAFQPTLSYTWSEKGLPPNPMIGYYSKISDSAKQWQDNLTGMKAKTDNVSERFMIDQLLGICGKQGSMMKSLLKRYQGPDGDDDLSNVRSLVGEKDPFIVIPERWTKRDSSLDFKVGDCAVVIYDGKILPAIIGDTGPCYKCGEVSLKLAKAVNPQATANFAAVSEPRATYIVFPGTALRKTHGPLKLEQLHDTVMKLVEQLGGLGKETHLHEWQD